MWQKFQYKWITNSKCEKTKTDFIGTSKVGPPLSGKTYLLMRKLKKNISVEVFDIASSTEQYNDEFVTPEKLICYSVKTGKKDGDFIDFDELLNYKEKTNDPFPTRGSHKDFEILQFSQSNFELPKKMYGR